MILGSAGLLITHRNGGGAQYQPGEANADITDSLGRKLPPNAPTPNLVDVTVDAGLADFVTFAGDRSSQLPEDMGPGAAWGDYDNDGDDDLFLVSAGGPLTAGPDRLAPSALFENLTNGRFRRVTGFPEPRVIGLAAAWGDADGDGWIDLVVTGYNVLLLYRNIHGRFERDPKFGPRNGFWSGAAWGDYDNDGDLDLYVCNYVQYVQTDADTAKASEQGGLAVPFTLNPASYPPGRNVFFRNNGTGVFTEVAEKLGVANPDGRSLSALWHDFDDDGWLDLYVANDISDNVLYHNVNGRFIDISHPAWVADPRGAMGLAAGDWNRDGDDDLFVTHWVAQENALYDSLLKDSGRLTFNDAADSAGLGQIGLPMVGWGTEFVDLDADGWLDLVVANGSTFETDDRPKQLTPQNPFLFWNARGEFFHDLAPFAAPLAAPHVGRGLAVSDFDNDGDIDILIMRHGERVQLLRNDMPQRNWVSVSLRARPTRDSLARPAIGAHTVAHVNGGTLRRAVTSASYLSQSSAVLHFGLGDATSIDRLEVRWRGGAIDAYSGLSAATRWEIVEGEPSPRQITRLPPRSTTAVMTPTPASTTDRERVVAFWNAQRAGMHAMKVERNCPKAIELFRTALLHDPAHEDARYYLGTCLAETGNAEGALQQYEELTRNNRQSHRGHAAWGTLRAITARSREDLARAEAALERAHRLNPEETGALLTLGEVALMRRDVKLARERLLLACQMNPRAGRGFFLLGYLRWKEGDTAGARGLLDEALQTRGPEWKPKGATAEGDVSRKAHSETTPLSRFWDGWDGAPVPAQAYARLDAYLTTVPR
jgi:Flp pilus assembly protein TadD